MWPYNDGSCSGFAARFSEHLLISMVSSPGLSAWGHLPLSVFNAGFTNADVPVISKAVKMYSAQQKELQVQ
jgi:hypothetical protein